MTREAARRCRGWTSAIIILMNKRITTAVAVYLILENEKDEILMMRRANTGYQDGMYQTPAGHVESGELPIPALIREAKEETDVDIDPSDVSFGTLGYREKHDETGNRVDIFFKVRTWKGEPKIMEPHKCDDMKWVPREHMPANTTPHVKIGIENTYSGLPYRELDIKWMQGTGEYKGEIK